MPFGNLLTAEGQYQFDSPRGEKFLMGKGTTVRVITVEGMLAMPDIRRQVTDRSGGHGGYAGQSPTMAVRTITADLVIKERSGPLAEQKLDQLMTVFNPLDDREGAFSFWRRGKEKRMVFASVKRAAFTGDYETSQGRISGSVEFESLDPRVYELEEQILQVTLPIAEGGRTYPRTYPVVYGEAGAGGNLVILNRGNVESPPVFRVYGPVTNPYVLNATLDREIRFIGTLANGQFLEVDTETRSIRLNGQESRLTMLDPVSEWWQLEPGTNDIRFLARTNDAGARLEMYSRSAWISG